MEAVLCHASTGTRLLELENFFFLALAHLFHLFDFVVGKLLDFVERALLIVLGDFLVFQRPS